MTAARLCKEDLMSTSFSRRVICWTFLKHFQAGKEKQAAVEQSLLGLCKVRMGTATQAILRAMILPRLAMLQVWDCEIADHP